MTSTPPNAPCGVLGGGPLPALPLAVGAALTLTLASVAVVRRTRS